MATIYLFRHGQTDFNRDQKFTGWMESHLTDLGRQQAQTIAGLLVNKTIKLAYKTRLSRSQETLNIVLKSHPECKKVITDDRLMERSYGDLAGETHQNIINGLGIGQYEQWHRGFYDQPPGGESFADVEDRVTEFLADFKNKYGGKNLNVAISAHGNSIRLFRKIMENATIEDCVSWTIPYDQYFEYNI
jgi:2,3-bisphosphoglycerate-dependent phosphoglycerate mutase